MQRRGVRIDGNRVCVRPQVLAVVLALTSLADSQLYAPPVPASSPPMLLPPVFSPPPPGGAASAPPALGAGPSVAFGPAPLLPPLSSSAPLVPPAFAPAPGSPPGGSGPTAFGPPGGGGGVPALVYGPPTF
ncbi:uncharacterized protein [Hetaerina americana]|uniref:uncharacterized protein n=1 Tax=Hetaerina americana TaxID=62018 RepID=UPI003A7F5760